VGACLAPIWIGSSQGSLASVQWRQRERSEYRRVGMCRRRGNDLNTGVWACAGGARTCAARWPTGGATGRRAAGALAAGRGRAAGALAAGRALAPGRESPGRAALQRVQRRDLRARQVSLLRREVLRDSLASPAPSTSVAGAVRRLRLPDGLHALPLQARGKRLAHFCGGKLQNSPQTGSSRDGDVVGSVARAGGGGVPAPRCVFACARCWPNPCHSRRPPQGERSNLDRGPVILSQVLRSDSYLSQVHILGHDF
jgi:hypothetical protein